MYSGTKSWVWRMLPGALAAALCVSAVPAHASSQTCTNTSVKGVNGYQCIDTTLISDASYCLRSKDDDPRHIRGMKSASALATVAANGQIGSARVYEFKTAAQAEDCYDSVPIKLMQTGDRIVILPNTSDGLTLSILSKSATPPFSVANFSVDLSPGPTVGNLTFYWFGSKNSVDYFVYLADDALGVMNDNDASGATPIEKFVRIEIFKQGAPAICERHRPDVGVTANNIPQIHPWNKGDPTCTVSTNFHEHGTGGGGQDYP